MLTADYSHLPEVHIAVRNFTKAPAKDITFDFSAPVENASGLVLSNLPYFEKGLPFLDPEGEVSCHWDSMPSLVTRLKERGLADGIEVTTKYKDLAGESYETQWTLNPLLFEGAPLEPSRGMDDLVEAVEKIPTDLTRRDGRRREVSGEGDNNGLA